MLRLRRILLLAILAGSPLLLTGCPGDSDPGDEIEEGIEEVGDEVDDAL